jgi:hypothetical protein
MCCRAGGWWRVAASQTPIRPTASGPIMGPSGSLPLVAVVAKFRPQAAQAHGSLCPRPSAPPPLGHGRCRPGWRRLPAADRQRRRGLLSQRLEPPLRAAAAPGEGRDEAAARP